MGKLCKNCGERKEESRKGRKYQLCDHCQEQYNKAVIRDFVQTSDVFD